MANEYLNDFIDRIKNAKSKDQLSEFSKLIFWGKILEAAGFGRITLNDVTMLEKLMNLDTEKYWKALEVATFGEEK